MAQKAGIGIVWIIGSGWLGARCGLFGYKTISLDKDAIVTSTRHRLVWTTLYTRAFDDHGVYRMTHYNCIRPYELIYDI